MYVQTVLDVHKKYNALVMSAFNNDAGFVAALDKVICLSTLFITSKLLILELSEHFTYIFHRLVVAS